MAQYDPGGRKSDALVDALRDLMALAQASNWPFELCLEKARGMAGQTKPETKNPALPPEQPLTEPWLDCQKCQRVHPEWAVCVTAPPGRTIHVELDPSGRAAAHVLPWFAKLPTALAQAERKMTDLFAGEASGS